ncbi:E3 ubiquitin-protein ligase [Apostasia shenzhenica]|uniref:RING-type E3 ubiquitin transferase n=1 Tax=Apostasia shenzhenica TaxID=1088818 RepID=A0A2I0ATB5_9ASPA|nr:E3 ubiquitin-protein ligase [Apostasia shenzhenica]
MGGCCCCYSKKTASERAPVYYYCPEDLEDDGPLSSTPAAPSAVPSHSVDLNLNVSITDSNQEHNALSPYVDLALSQSNTRNSENCANKDELTQPTDFAPVGDAYSEERFENPDMCHGLKNSKSVIDCVTNSPKVNEKLPNLGDPKVPETDEEDVCPTCLEEYDAENPRIITKCNHHFHLACILEWMERSNTCAICDKIMEINEMLMAI